jgi:nucleoside-diphosphate kinase
MERTFLMVKPDAVARAEVGGIVSKVEKVGFKIVAMKMLLVDQKLAHEHYKEHTDKPFFEDLVALIASGPSVAMVLEGEDCIKSLRALVGSTNPAEAAPGTIRTEFGIDVGRNAVHASDSPESAEREINLFFNRSEIH